MPGLPRKHHPLSKLIGIHSVSPPAAPLTVRALALLFCRTFPDGFPNLFVKDAMRIRNRHVGFLGSFSNPASIFEQISIIYAIPRMFVESFTLVSANQPYNLPSEPLQARSCPPDVAPHLLRPKIYPPADL